MEEDPNYQKDAKDPKKRERGREREPDEDTEMQPNKAPRARRPRKTELQRLQEQGSALSEYGTQVIKTCIERTRGRSGMTVEDTTQVKRSTRIASCKIAKKEAEVARQAAEAQKKAEKEKLQMYHTVLVSPIIDETNTNTKFPTLCENDRKKIKAFELQDGKNDPFIKGIQSCHHMEITYAGEKNIASIQQIKVFQSSGDMESDKVLIPEHTVDIKKSNPDHVIILAQEILHNKVSNHIVDNGKQESFYPLSIIKKEFEDAKDELIGFVKNEFDNAEVKTDDTISESQMRKLIDDAINILDDDFEAEFTNTSPDTSQNRLVIKTEPDNEVQYLSIKKPLERKTFELPDFFEKFVENHFIKEHKVLTDFGLAKKDGKLIITEMARFVQLGKENVKLVGSFEEYVNAAIVFAIFTKLNDALNQLSLEFAKLRIGGRRKSASKKRTSASKKSPKATKAKSPSQKEKEKAKLKAQKEKEKLQKQKAHAKLKAQKEKEKAKLKLQKEKEKAKLKAQKEKAKLQKQKEQAKLKAQKAKAAKAKAAPKKSPTVSKKRAVSKKA